jgi:hypothetical protein
VLLDYKEVIMSEDPSPNQLSYPTQSRLSLHYSQPIYPPQQQPVPYTVQPPPYVVQPVYVQSPHSFPWWYLMPWWAKALFILGMLALAGIIIFICVGFLDGFRFLA